MSKPGVYQGQTVVFRLYKRNFTILISATDGWGSLGNFQIFPKLSIQRISERLG